MGSGRGGVVLGGGGKGVWGRLGGVILGRGLLERLLVLGNGMLLRGS